MKRSLLAIAAAGALALVLAGGTFLAFKLTASAGLKSTTLLASLPGNPASGVTGGVAIIDADGTAGTCGPLVPAPLTCVQGTVGGISAFTVPAWTGYPPVPPPQVGLTFFSALNCAPAAEAGVTVTDPQHPLLAPDLRLVNGVTKSGLIITPGNTPYYGGTGPILSAGVTVIAGEFRCADNVDNDTDGLINDGCAVLKANGTGNYAEPKRVCANAVDNDGDSAINDGCPTLVDPETACGTDTVDDDADTLVNDGCPAVDVAEPVAVCTETNCADADGARPWDLCDDDTDGQINDGCAASGAAEPDDPIRDNANNQYLACANFDGSSVTGWTGLLGPDWKMLVFQFAIDTDPWGDGITDYPCKDIDATNTVGIGSNHEVAVCTVNEPRLPAGGLDSVSAFSFNLTYSPTLNECTAKNCSLKSPCTEDDNPDANAGLTLGSGYPTGTQCRDAVDANEDGAPDKINDGCPAKGAAETIEDAGADPPTVDQCSNAIDDDSDTLVNDGCPPVGIPEMGGLGYGWDCSGVGTIEPTCTAGQAVMNCFSMAGPYTSGLLSPFPLAIVKFKALAAGTDTIVTNTNVWNGATGEKNPVSISGAVLKEPPTPTPLPTATNTPLPTATPTATPTPKPTNTAVPGVKMEKSPELDVLWLMKSECNPLQPDPVRLAEGKGCLVIEKSILEANDTDSPNDSDDVAEGVGTWEEQIKYDHKLLTVVAVPDNAWLTSGGRIAICTMTILTENWILTGCVTKDRGWCADNLANTEDSTADTWINDGCPKVGDVAETQCNENPCVDADGKAPWDSCDNDHDGYINDGCPAVGNPESTLGPNGNGLIEKIYLYPKTSDLIYRQGFRPTKDNGVRTDLVDENCEVADTLGEKIPGTLPGGLTTTCTDAHITMRMLEGDVNLDCVVDVKDDQAIAFRYGTFFGLTLYDEWYDLAPECIKYPCDRSDPLDGDVTDPGDVCEQCTTGVPDFDIDIKDLQFVFGRNYSTCQAPIPNLQGVPMLPPQEEFEK